MAEDKIKVRVGKIAEMLEMSGQLNARAAGLAADAKQKISLGRGLVREDVSAVLFDEPLTVIDPHLKWQLRRKLKQIHHELKLTLIYVTHDQVEALTFAEQVVVMTRGRAVQIGSASELFERPQHTFVGHFIGSPGMNFLPTQWSSSGLAVGGQHVLPPGSAMTTASATLLGVRPEYVTLAAPNQRGAIRAVVTQAQDIGTYWLITARIGEATIATPSDVGVDDTVIRARLSPEQTIPSVGEAVWLAIVGPHTCYYKDEQLIAQEVSA
jgi:glycerol transport system ATP-binding protein